MLKLSLATTLFLSVAGSIMDSPAISIPPDKKIKTQEIFTLIQTIQNGLQNNRTTPSQPQNTELFQTFPILYPQTPTPI